MKENKEKNIVMNQRFVGDIRSIIDKARAAAVRSVDRTYLIANTLRSQLNWSQYRRRSSWLRKLKR